MAIRVAIIADLAEEHWPSMDLVAEMLFEELRRSHASTITPALIRAPFRLRLGHLAPRWRSAVNIDRGLNRFVYYPRFISRLRNNFNLFHIMDHSYAHLALELPPDRVVITCHDLDAFECLIVPETGAPLWYPTLARKLLTGLQRASRIICVTGAIRDELIRHGLVAQEKLSVISNGVDAVCNPHPDAAADSEAEKLLGPRSGAAVDILHVGSSIARKRIDVALKVFANVRRLHPHARLIRVGGPLTPQQERLVQELSLGKAMLNLPFVSRPVLAAIYRRACLVVLPSEAEGFGLPLVEALSCGTPVVCSDLPALREVGGKAPTFCPVGEVTEWCQAVEELLCERQRLPGSWEVRRMEGMQQASKFSWSTNASSLANLYKDVVKREKSNALSSSEHSYVSTQAGAEIR